MQKKRVQMNQSTHYIQRNGEVEGWFGIRHTTQLSTSFLNVFHKYATDVPPGRYVRLWWFFTFFSLYKKKVLYSWKIWTSGFLRRQTNRIKKYFLNMLKRVKNDNKFTSRYRSPVCNKRLDKCWKFCTKEKK